jgi:hypothetical protein
MNTRLTGNAVDGWSKKPMERAILGGLLPPGTTGVLGLRGRPRFRVTVHATPPVTLAGYAWRIVPMFAGMLETDRKRWGLRVCRAAWLLGVSVRQYRELEAGTASPSFETWDRMCKLFGWSQRFTDRQGG